MMENTRLFLNAPVAFGRGSLQYLAQLGGRRAAIVSDDEAMERLGFLEKAVVYLNEAGMETQVVARVAREPNTEAIDAARPAVAEFEPDWIVGLGGGSVLDSAKALWVFRQQPDLSWEAAFQFNGLPPMSRSRLVAIPSTSGTGSETSRVSVIIDASTGMKRLIFSPEIIPTLAILDPALPATMPPWLAASSAFDALSHAIESSVATISNEFTFSSALGAIRLIFEHLPASYHESDPWAREKVHYAATIAGMGINNSTAGLAHGMDQVGPLFGVPHGIVCAVLLPYTMAFLFDVAADKFAEMGRSLGLSGNNVQDLAQAFLAELTALQRKVELPLAFRDLGISEEAFQLQLDDMITAAQVSGSTHLSPRIPSADEIRDIFLQSYYGRLPEELMA
jgi:alcohol dehydrogenase class IV